jgi:tRNA (cytidine/uridine-2'-O-)-methyltransferase
VSEAWPKIRFASLERPLHVVLVEPEIPQNTGAIGRLCAATGSRLHLVGRLGFDISQKAVRRAGMDYWSQVDVSMHDDLEGFLRAVRPVVTILLTSNARRSYLEAPYVPGAALVLGGESKGLPARVLADHPDAQYGIPTAGGIRSLNLASAASVALYEALRVTGALDETFCEEP